MRRIWFALLTGAILLAACGPKPDTGLQVQQAVAATLSALPTAPPAPTTVPLPSATSASLTGLFCEYQFCIGHPPEMAFLDGMALRDPLNPSRYAEGLMAAYQGNLYIQLEWQSAPGIDDPSFMLDTILQDGVDTPSGSQTTKLVRDLNVVYTALTTSAHPATPYGGAAAWTCGDRAFAWKIYTPQPESAEALFNDALSRFRCEVH